MAGKAEPPKASHRRIRAPAAGDIAVPVPIAPREETAERVEERGEMAEMLPAIPHRRPASHRARIEELAAVSVEPTWAPTFRPPRSPR
jgi:hypothetical protein